MWNERRWLVPLAGASLLINVLLVGVLIGHSYGLWLGARPHAPETAIVPPSHVRALPKDERKQFNAVMARHRDAIRAGREEQRRLRRQTEADIAAPSFDSAKVTADFKALRDNGLMVQQQVHEGLVEALAGLSPAARAALVQRAERDTAPAGDKAPPPR